MDNDSQIDNIRSLHNMTQHSPSQYPTQQYLLPPPWPPTPSCFAASLFHPSVLLQADLDKSIKKREQSQRPRPHAMLIGQVTSLIINLDYREVKPVYDLTKAEFKPYPTSYLAIPPKIKNKAQRPLPINVIVNYLLVASNRQASHSRKKKGDISNILKCFWVFGLTITNVYHSSPLSLSSFLFSNHQITKPNPLKVSCPHESLIKAPPSPTYLGILEVGYPAQNVQNSLPNH